MPAAREADPAKSTGTGTAARSGSDTVPAATDSTGPRGTRRGLFTAQDPTLVAEWAIDLNGPIPTTLTAGSSRRPWWRCSQCRHTWQAVVGARVRTGTGCPACAPARGLATRKAGRTLADVRPDLVAEWDHERNDRTPHAVTAGSDRIAWWRCSACGWGWQAQIASRVRIPQGMGCPACAGRHRQPLSETHPHLAAQWDQDHNTVDPDAVTAGSERVVAWRCERGHHWTAQIASRTKGGGGCPRCPRTPNPPLAVTHPWLATAWDTATNGPLRDHITSGAADTVGWRCPQGHHWAAPIKARAAGAYPCPQCPTENKREPGTPIAAKLNPDQVRAIRDDPRPTHEVAHTHRVTASTIVRIRAGRAWKNLT
ncbi:zinc-ribbon domain-containing protein [Longispora sp. NPDC051575]|uniref:zinc-ribbon domain-containing protein n=1 Tax=Longispora sp. NPDC051575 TaxID=3154943 RepID=UPI003427FF96